MIDWDKIKSEYETEDISLKALAEKYKLSPSTVRSRKNREKWQRNDSSDVATRRNATDKRGGQRANQNAIGNRGGPPRGSQNAFKHGLFAKHLPKEAQEIAAELFDSDPSDILWNQIIIQYTAIIRAQEIMFVESKEEMIQELKRHKESSGESSWSEEKEWDFQFSWDRHATFLNSQSRAMSAMANLIKQFVAMTDEADERRQKLELMNAQLTKTKAEAAIIENQAAKLTQSGKVNELLQSLLDVKSGGDGSANIQP